MDCVLEGFTDELLKLAGRHSPAERENTELRALYRNVKKQSQKSGAEGLKGLRGSRQKMRRDYLASTAIGAVATPAALLLGSRISRVLHNRDVLRAMKGVRGKRRRALATHLETGPALGRGGAFAKGKRPLMTRGELAGAAVRGGAFGSVIQMLRDRFSTPAGTGSS